MVTVNTAIKRGQLSVNLPVMLIMFSVLGLCIFLVTDKQAPGYLILASILLAPLTGWIYWSFVITRWRIWAFTNVDNVHELKSRAISCQLIWPDGHIFEKTEIRTKKEKEIIKDLDKRFLENPPKRKVLNDDPTVPSTTVVFYSKKYLLVEMIIFGVASLLLGIYVFVTSDHWIIGTFFGIMGAYIIIKDIVKLTNDRAQLTLDQNGIKVKDKHYPWLEISNVTITAASNKWFTYSNKWLTLETDRGMINETVDDFDISITDLEHRINVYLLRSEQATTANRVARPTSKR